MKSSQFLRELFGDQEGYLAVSFGRIPHQVTFYHWPTEKASFAADVKKNKNTNVFFCPLLRKSKKLSERGGLVRTNKPVEPISWLYADLDLIDGEGNEKEVNHTLLDQLPFVKVQSGTPGHYHLYLKLDEPVGLAEHQKLNKALKDALGADHKHSHVSWLRVPSSFNHKPELGKPTRVRLVTDDVEPVSIERLNSLLAPDHASRTQSRATSTTRRQRVSQTSVPSSVRRVMREWRTVEQGKRNEAVYAIVAEAKKQGLSIGEATDLIRNHPAGERFKSDRDLVSDVERIWDKAEDAPVEAKPRLRVRRASEIKARRQRWLWNHRIPLGALTLIGGAEGTGKSTTCVDIAARVTRGELDGEYSQPKAVIYLAHEDNWETYIKPRLMAARADMDLILHVTVENEGDEDWVSLPEHIELIQELIEEENVGLIVLDPILSVLDGNVDDTKGRQLRKALEPINRLSEKCGVLGIHHFNKRASSKGSELFSGLRVWRQVARATLILVQDEEDKSMFYLSNDKNNNAPASTPTLLGRIASMPIELDDGEQDTPYIDWEGETDVHAEDVLKSQLNGVQRSPGTTHPIDAWLADLFKDGKRRRANDIKEAAEAQGYSYDTVGKRFRGKFGGTTKREGFGPGGISWWYPPNYDAVVVGDGVHDEHDNNDEYDEHGGTHLTRDTHFSPSMHTNEVLNHTRHSRHSRHSRIDVTVGRVPVREKGTSRPLRARTRDQARVPREKGTSRPLRVPRPRVCESGNLYRATRVVLNFGEK